MLMKIAYVLSALGGISLLAFAAPSGTLLTSKTPASKVSRSADPKAGHGTVRGRGPAFIFLGGGYHGGK